MKVFFLLLALLVAVPVCIAETNYCNDAEAWQEWDELIAKYPQDMDVQMLHAVRIGFCKKIKDKTITFEKAVQIFDELHRRVYKKTLREQIKKDGAISL